MGKTRVEAFSDGVIAIIITIMVLELKVPHGGSYAELAPLIPILGSYVLSFVYVGIYWNNHHHMFHMVQKVSGSTLWANLHLLFWLSLTPFVTAWMGENHFAAAPVAAYGVVLVMCAIAYTILARVLTHNHPENHALAEAIGIDRKGWISIGFYIVGIALSTPFPMAGFAMYVLVAIVWLIPDTRIEKRMQNKLP
jgi:uncharacterized membrane protein